MSQSYLAIMLCLLNVAPCLSNSRPTSCPYGCRCSLSTEDTCDWCEVTTTAPILCEGCGDVVEPSASATVTVNCQSGNLENMPRDFPQPTVTLDFSNNLLNALSSSLMLPLRQVVNLKLSSNKIQGIVNSTFRQTSSIQILDLDGNQLSIVSHQTFVGAESLVHLDLSGNQLTSTDGAFSTMKDLSRLDLRNNQLSEITQQTFKGLTGLRYLLLSSNQIRTIDRRAFRPLEKLVYLLLKGNPIGPQTTRFQFNSPFLSYIDISECGFAEVPKGLPGSARYIQLRRNNLTTLTRNHFLECPYVTILVLDENQIEDVADDTFSHMTSLQQLWLNHNKLKQIPSLLSASVQRLLMDFNVVESITNIFPVLSEMNTLSLMGNVISFLEHDALENLSGLKTLDLSNNRLQHIYGNSFQQQIHLRTLQLSNNPLEFLHSRCLHGLDQLRTLSLAYVPTNTSLHDDIFEDLLMLNKLDIDSSPGVVASILSSDTLLSALSSVSDLSLKSSDLTHLRHDLPSFLPSLTSLHLTSSRWHCDRSLMWLRDWLVTTTVKVEDVEENRCATPRPLYDRTLLSLEDDDFAAVITTLDGQATYSPVQLTTFRLPRVKVPRISPTVAAGSNANTTLTSTRLRKYNKDTQSVTDNTRKQNEGNKFSGDTDYDQIVDNSLRKDEVEELPKFLLKLPEYVLDSVPKSTISDRDEELLQGLSNLAKGELQSSSTVETVQHPQTYSSNTIVLVVITVLATVVTAIIIITAIYRLTNAKKPACNKELEHASQASISYRHKNGVLYYTTSTTSVTPSGVFRTGRQDDGDPALGKTGSTEMMALIPGRDINHEGPLRVYKWEDF